MGWKQVTNNAMDIKKEKGKQYVGVFTGFKKITTKIGEQIIWQFNDDQGSPFGIYGFTNLNSAMSCIIVNTLCRITYLGTVNVKTKFGMKDVHQVSVEVSTND